MFNQFQMNISQFGFIGLMVVFLEQFGAAETSDKELEGCIYLWRGLGYLLGIGYKYMGGCNKCAKGVILSSLSSRSHRRLGTHNPELWRRYQLLNSRPNLRVILVLPLLDPGHHGPMSPCHSDMVECMSYVKIAADYVGPQYEIHLPQESI